MAELQNFRSAFNGFNREDVVHYIEYINARQESQLAQLQTELQSAQEQLQHLREAPVEPVDNAELSALQERCAALESDNARLAEENAQLLASVEEATAPAAQDFQKELEALQQQLAQVTRERNRAVERLESPRGRTDDELEAYRRAERMEREARERVKQLYHQANGTMADAGTQLSDASALLSKTADLAAAKLGELLDTITQSKTALRQATKTLAAMAPETEED